MDRVYIKFNFSFNFLGSISSKNMGYMGGGVKYKELSDKRPFSPTRLDDSDGVSAILSETAAITVRILCPSAVSAHPYRYHTVLRADNFEEKLSKISKKSHKNSTKYLE